MKGTYIDLFAGIGGWSIGMEQAGFKSLGFVEIDHAAAQAHRRTIPGAEQLASDIKDFEARGLAGKVDVVVGSPPCVTFSSNGRSALKEGIKEDERTDLWREWARVVLECRPHMAFMENVPGMMDHMGVNLCEEVASTLREHYHVVYAVLDVAQYGVPQHRERLFLVAIKRARLMPLDSTLFPYATHRARERVHLAQITRRTLPVLAPGLRQLPNPSSHRPQAVTVAQALADLPHECGLGGPDEDSYMEIDPLYAHWTRRLSARDRRLVELMEPGDNYMDMYRRVKSINEAAGELLYALPPQSPDKFRTRWYRLLPDEPSITITHHLGHGGLTHLHPVANRSITIREAARLQSFPDEVLFPGGIGESMFQIGNAVPPMMARLFGDVAARIIASIDFDSPPHHALSPLHQRISHDTKRYLNGHAQG